MLNFSKLPKIDEKDLKPYQLLYEQRMLARENFFEKSFGQSVPGGKVLVSMDPQLRINWPGGGVFQYAPNEERSFWTYITHGLSQPDYDYEYEEFKIETLKKEYSGLGIELIVTTRE